MLFVNLAPLNHSSHYIINYDMQHINETQQYEQVDDGEYDGELTINRSYSLRERHHR
jgi:hypothetical protein